MRSCTKPPAELPQPAATALAVPTILQGAAASLGACPRDRNNVALHCTLALRQPAALLALANWLPQGTPLSNLSISNTSHTPVPVLYRPTWG